MKTRINAAPAVKGLNEYNTIQNTRVGYDQNTHTDTSCTHTKIVFHLKYSSIFLN